MKFSATLSGSDLPKCSQQKHFLLK